MKKNTFIIIGIILVLSVGVLIYFKCNNNDNIPYQDAPYLNIRYAAKDEWACLEFRTNGDYTMYDCDSEPTNYFFDSENECTYNYIESKNEVNFKCDNEYSSVKNKSIKIIEWDENKIRFSFDNEEKTFYANIEKDI